MTQAQRFSQSLYCVVESTPGTTPTTPTLIEIPIAGPPTIAIEKDNFSSNVIKSHRQTSTVRHGVRRTVGEIPVEFAYGDFDALFESALCGAFSTNVLKVGTTKKFFTLERRFTDISEFQPFLGCMFNGFSLSAQPNGMVTGAFNVLGFGSMTPGSATIATTSTAATGNEPFDGFTGSITEGGSAANITAIDFNVTNNAVPSYIVGSDTAPGINIGMFNVSGNVSAYFETEALLNKFLGETETAIVLTLEGITGGDLAFNIPALKFTGGSITEADEGLIVSMPFTGYYDASAATSLTITRTAA